MKWGENFGIREGFGCFLVIIAGAKLYISRFHIACVTEISGGKIGLFILFSEYNRPKHFSFEGVSAHDHSQTDATILAMRAQNMGLKVYSEPGFL